MLVGAIVWGIRQEGRINSLESQANELRKHIDTLDDVGTAAFRTRFAVIDQRLKEILKGFTPYGVQNLEGKVFELKGRIEAFEKRTKELEEKMIVQQQRPGVR